VAATVDFQLDVFLSAEPGAFSSALRTSWTWSGMVGSPVLPEEWSEAVSEIMCHLRTLGFPTARDRMGRWVELVNIAPLTGRTFYHMVDIQTWIGTPLTGFPSFDGHLTIVLAFADGYKPRITGVWSGICGINLPSIRAGVVPRYGTVVLILRYGMRPWLRERKRRANPPSIDIGYRSLEFVSASPESTLELPL